MFLRILFLVNYPQVYHLFTTHYSTILSPTLSLTRLLTHSLTPQLILLTIHLSTQHIFIRCYYALGGMLGFRLQLRLRQRLFLQGAQSSRGNKQIYYNTISVKTVE